MNEMIDPFKGEEVRRTVTVIESPFAQRCRRCREKHGWTQEQAAKKAGIGRTQLTNIERGCRPSLRSFIRLCQTYDVSADWLLWGDKNARD